MAVYFRWLAETWVVTWHLDMLKVVILQSNMFRWPYIFCLHSKDDDKVT